MIYKLRELLGVDEMGGTMRLGAWPCRLEPGSLGDLLGPLLEERADIAALELRHRGHARVEDRVRTWKDCGLANLPFDGFCANEAWVALSLIAGALLAWSQMICFDGALAKAEPKTMRYRVLHVAAVLAHRGRDLIVHLDETWPWASELATAFTRLRAAFP